MNFEHLIEITDPNNPLIEAISRHQLWRGLVLRAEQPELSVVGLDACVILERSENYLKRELRFGRLRIKDTVELALLEQVTYHVEASDNYPASQLIMKIEEPFPEHLFLRFIYRSVNLAEDSDEMVTGHLKQAYEQSDNDTVAVIRKLAQMGKLGEYISHLPH